MPINSLLLNRADSAVISRDYALASRLYSTLLKENSGDKDLLVRLGNVYIRSGEDEKALPVFQKLLETDSQNADTLLTLGGIFRRIGRYEESIEILNKALKAGAKEESAYYNLGFTYKLMGKYEDAIDCFEVVVTLDPGDVLAYNHLGVIYELKGDHEGAIAAYQKGLKIDQNHPVLHLNLAKTYENFGNTDCAIREYEAALRYKPGWGEAYSDYTNLLLKIGRVSDAQNIAEQGISLNAGDARLQSVLGDIYMAESDYEAAEKRYADSIQIEGERPAVLEAFARSLEAQGKNVEALDAIQKARDAFPDDEQLLKESASINLSAQKIVDAGRDIKELIDKDKNDLETLDLAGQYYICTNDERRAQKAYKKIELSDSKYKKHLSNASNRYKQKGDLEKAENYINRYLAANPCDAKALVSLASIEERLGNMNEALENYNRALAYDTNNHIARISAKRLVVSVGAANVSDAPKVETQESQDKAEETDKLEAPVETEQEIPQEETVADNQVEESLSNDDADDLNLDAFGETPLLDDDEELDFFGIADANDEGEASVSEDMNLLGEEPSLDDGIFEASDAAVEPSPSPAIENFEKEASPETKPEENSASESPAATNALSGKISQMAESTRRVLEAAQVAQLAAATSQLAARQTRVFDDTGDMARKLAEEKAALEDAARKLAEEKVARKLAEEEAARKAAEESAKRMAEEKAVAEEAAKKLAEEQEAARREAEENARKLAEQKTALEEAERKLQEEQKAARKAVEEAKENAKKIAFEEAMKKMQSFVPAVENILKSEDSERDFESHIKLFKTLRALSESLPQEEKKEFLQSRPRVALDYLISSLEGEPGLLKTSVALRKSGMLSDVVPEDASDETASVEELLETVVGDMKSLSKYLEEEDLSIALTKLADDILGRE